MVGGIIIRSCCAALVLSPRRTDSLRKSSVFPARPSIAANIDTPEPFREVDDAIFRLSTNRIMSVMRPFTRVAARAGSPYPSCVRTFASSAPCADEPKRSDVFGGDYYSVACVVCMC